MQQSSKTLRNTIELTDLELKIEIYQIFNRAYYKIFYKGEDIIHDYDIHGITFDLKGTITLLNYLALCERVEPHEDLSDYLVEYEDEGGSGPRTTYFQEAFKTHS